MRRRLLGVLLAAGALPSSSAAQVGSPPPAGLEAAYSRLRHWDDQHRLLLNRGTDVTPGALTAAAVAESLAAARHLFEAEFRAGPDPATSGDPALRLMAHEWEAGLAGRSNRGAPEREIPGDCGAPIVPGGRRTAELAPLTEWIYRCFGMAAERIIVGGDTLNRLALLGRLGRTADPARRRELFLALAPIWRSVNGDDTPLSPYRTLLRLRHDAWGDSLPPILGKGPAWGLSPAEVEDWLVGALERWRTGTPDIPLEPWDWYYATGAASRALDSLAPRLADLRRINRDYYAQLGADPEALGVEYDLQPRPGKDPVAFTDFGDRAHREADGVVPTQPWVFTSYLAGGLDNLEELLHESGHAVHIAGIRVRPAYLDWPDNDTFVEALADLPALELYEPAWQRRFLGDTATTAASLRAKYGGIMFDMAWALFEIRVHRDPSADPNQVWTEITSRYLHIRPHPEWSWWALRGQLVDAPGYLINYALGAFIAADLRARVTALHGAFATADDGTYAWLTERLYRFGRERSSRRVLEEFLGRPLRAEALFRDLDRLR